MDLVYPVRTGKVERKKGAKRVKLLRFRLNSKVLVSLLVRYSILEYAILQY